MVLQFIFLLRDSENDPLIIGEMRAGNTSVKMRNTGVAILDTLLSTSTIDKKQYKQIDKMYFTIN